MTRDWLNKTLDLENDSEEVYEVAGIYVKGVTVAEKYRINAFD